MSTIDEAAARAAGRQEERNESEGRKTADRLWAYSDAVFAVIVTIMVLQLKPPKSADLSALLTLWPTLISYVVSYVFIAIIWINHHYLMSYITVPSLRIVWINFGHLFFVWLGASLQVRELADHPEFIVLGVGLGVGAVLAHGAGRLLGQPLALAALGAAQLGVPVAAATLGIEEDLLAPGEASALILGALVTIAVTSVAGTIAKRGQLPEPTEAEHA